jgi:presenilin-like A22 family membrane protease
MIFEKFLRRITLFSKALMGEACFFVFTLILGIFQAKRLISFGNHNSVFYSSFSFSFNDFLFILVFNILFILTLVYLSKKKQKAGFISKIFFILSIFLGTLLTFFLWLPQNWALVLSLILMFLLLKFRILILHNLLLAFTLATIGAIIGLNLDPLIIIIFLTILSIYDFVAVYKTRHMITLVKVMAESGSIMGFVLPQDFRKIFLPLRDFSFQNLKDKYIVLGSGDVILPLMMAVSLIKEGIFLAFFVIFFSFLGFLANFLVLFSQERKSPIPALPIIALFTILGYLLTRFF